MPEYSEQPVRPTELLERKTRIDNEGTISPPELARILGLELNQHYPGRERAVEGLNIDDLFITRGITTEVTLSGRGITMPQRSHASLQDKAFITGEVQALGTTLRFAGGFDGESILLVAPPQEGVTTREVRIDATHPSVLERVVQKFT